MILRYFIVPCIFFAGWLAGCATGRETESNRDQAPSATEAPHKSPLAQHEAGFTPSDFDEPIEQVLRTHETRKQLIEVTEAESVYVEAEYMQGFRIQIFATASIDEANAMKMTAAEQVTDDSLYVVFDPPVYKVRLGDFTTRMEANRKLATLVEKGFPDAWVVGDRIVQFRTVRVKPRKEP